MSFYNQAGLGCIVSCALIVISVGIFSAVYSSVVGFGNHHHDLFTLKLYVLYHHHEHHEALPRKSKENIIRAISMCPTAIFFNYI